MLEHRILHKPVMWPMQICLSSKENSALILCLTFFLAKKKKKEWHSLVNQLKGWECFI